MLPPRLSGIAVLRCNIACCDASKSSHKSKQHDSDRHVLGTWAKLWTKPESAESNERKRIASERVPRPGQQQKELPWPPVHGCCCCSRSWPLHPTYPPTTAGSPAARTRMPPANGAAAKATASSSHPSRCTSGRMATACTGSRRCRSMKRSHLLTAPIGAAGGQTGRAAVSSRRHRDTDWRSRSGGDCHELVGARHRLRQVGIDLLEAADAHPT